MSFAVIVAFAISLTCLWYLVSSLRRKYDLPLPPGPSGLPVVGNIKDLCPAGVPEFQHWLKHKDLYGPISYLNILGTRMIIIHDKQMAVELMEKRGNVHSGRPSMKFVMDMIGWKNLTISQQNNKTFRLHRKYAAQQIGSVDSLARYHDLQEAAVGHFLWRINQEKGAGLKQHLKTLTGEVIVKIIYGYNIESHSNDPLIDQADLAMANFSEASVPGRWLVDIMPWLAYVPEWLPGAQFKKTARLWRGTLEDAARRPFEFVRTQRANGADQISYVARIMDQVKEEDSFDEHVIKWSALGLYLGGADTTVFTMRAFFLAMSMFHDVQRKAQQEIDDLVSSSRLPTFDDRAKLPYVNALVMEAQRWHPIAPMGFPHASDEADNLNRYRIPKGSLLLPNVWWFTRDPAVYHDAEDFKPERYFEPYNEPDPTAFTFGFGRRICPGRFLASSTLYLAIAQTLAAFNIESPQDQNGQEVHQKHGFKPGILSELEPFAVRVSPRSVAHEKLIQDVLRKYPWEKSDKDFL